MSWKRRDELEDGRGSYGEWKGIERVGGEVKEGC
jgi:hypothetical protein